MRNFAVLALLAFAADQATKLQARRLLSEDAALILVEDRLWAMLAFNPHGAFSWGTSLPSGVLLSLLLAANAVFAFILLRWLHLPEFESPAARSGLALIAGGGAGNLFDRLWDSRGVTDFLMAGRGVPELGVFNLADLWIALGTVLTFLAVAHLKLTQRQTKSIVS